jgi:glycosyl transferase family 87
MPRAPEQPATWVDTVLASWRRHRSWILWTIVVVLGVVSLLWLGYEWWRVIWKPQRLGTMWVHPGGLDLEMRWEELRDWFSGKTVYGVRPRAVYPPASYAMLWPFLGWVSRAVALAGWAVTAALALAWLVRLAVRESRAASAPERWFVLLLPLSMYATGAGIGNGQITLQVLALMLGGIFLLERGSGRVANHLAVALLVLAALVKPSLSAPFFWIVMFARGGWRPAAFVVAGYLALTVVGASFQDYTLPGVMEHWADRSTATASKGHLVVYAVGTTTALAHLGLGNWVAPMSVLILVALGAWLYWQRQSDLWLQLGVAAIANRFWTLHLWYDDLLFLLPMIALFRLLRAPDRTPGRTLTTGILLFVLVATNVAPGGLFLLPLVLNNSFTDAYVVLQVVVWIAVLIFLMVETVRLSGRNAAAAGSVSGPSGPPVAPASPAPPPAADRA